MAHSSRLVKARAPWLPQRKSPISYHRLSKKKLSDIFNYKKTLENEVAQNPFLLFRGCRRKMGTPRGYPLGVKYTYGSVRSCHVMSCHVMSCHVMSCHVMSCHVMSCHGWVPVQRPIHGHQNKSHATRIHFFFGGCELGAAFAGDGQLEIGQGDLETPSPKCPYAEGRWCFHFFFANQSRALRARRQRAQ